MKKGNEHKMPRMEDILNLPVQDPPCAEFSAALINWVKVEGGRQGGDDVALIPFSRVDDFVKGESANVECPASFRVESRRKRTEGSVSKPRVDGYLEYTLYWCSYGPEDYRHSDSSVGDNLNSKPQSGKGSRPGRRHMMRGCLCHFTVKTLIHTHVDKSGSPCHGILDRDAVGTRAMYAPRISDELRQKVMSMLYVGISWDDIIQHHTDVVERHGGPSNRDDFLTRNDVRNMERVVKHSTREVHENDVDSIPTWVHRHQKHVFFFRDVTESFVLGLQTEWQLQQMLHYGNNSSIAFHSTFGLKKFKHPLCTLLVFDSCQNAIPVAWIITSCFNGQDIPCWMVPLVERIRRGILGGNPIDAFQCRVILCLWHVRRSWMKSLLKKCCSLILQQEMFKYLGRILYSVRDGPSAIDAIEEFMQIFVDQFSFMEYFRDQWLPRIDMWVNAMRLLPIANQEFNGAIESYHLNLKSKLFGEQHSGSWTRVDWLVHTLTTEFHSLYWFAQYTEETGYFRNLKECTFTTNSWYRALQIPDIDVLFDDEELRIIRVISQSNRSMAYTIWNPGSEFSYCDCPWSRLGNLCKHVIKVCMLFRNRQVARPSIAAQTYRQALLSLLNNPPDDPIVLNHAILQVNRIQQDIKGLEDLSNSGLLQPLTTLETNGHVVLDNLLPSPGLQ
ncbi:hypothetical protein MKW92_045214 [Papaver armeniacum]|nr:hypothetical protein MKW92_045214 [Papaver armeniacum]